jgi:hypothetical protein
LPFTSNEKRSHLLFSKAADVKVLVIPLKCLNVRLAVVVVVVFIVEVRRTTILRQYCWRSQRTAQSMFPNVPKQEQLADFIISDRGMVVKFNVPVLLLSKRKN